MIWRLISQLTELTPHLMRLVPLLDRLSSSSSTPPELLADLQETVTELKNANQTSVKQMKDQSLHMAAIEGRLEEQQLYTARVEERLDEMKHRYRSTEMRLGLLLALMGLLLVANTVALALVLFGKR